VNQIYLIVSFVCFFVVCCAFSSVSGSFLVCVPPPCAKSGLPLPLPRGLLSFL